MTERTMECFIGETLAGDAQRNALAFAAYLRAQGMSFERGKGYWEDKLYWSVSYASKCVCYVLVDAFEEANQPWVVWSDDSGSNGFSDFPLDEPMKETAWAHVDFCSHCGGCAKPGGTRKAVFGKEFHNVCITTLRFDNPDAKALEFAKKMVDIRKSEIIGDA